MFSRRLITATNSRLGDKIWAFIIVAPFLASCAGNGGGFHAGDNAPNVRVNINAIPDAVPRIEPLSRYGNPDSYVVNGKKYFPKKQSKGFVERGIASWYGTKFHGRRTSSGETYNLYTMTAAHKTLPLPSYVEVTNLSNGRHVIVRVNDRGPFHDNRIIDLSYVAAMKLGITKTGTAEVEIRAIDPRAPQAHRLKNNHAATNSYPTGLERAQSMYLQVGAFSSLQNAENLRKKLDNLALRPIKITPTKHTDKALYRVRIGPLNDNKEIRQMAGQLADLGITNTSIIFD